MNKDQKGFAPVIVIIIIIAVVGIGFASWRVISKNSGDNNAADNNATVASSEPTDASDDSSSNQEPAEKPNNDESASLSDNEVTYLEEGISLLLPGDLDKLPSNTPESFKTYLRDKYLGPNQYSTDDCVNQVVLTKLSLYNYSGSLAPNNNPALQTNNCEGLGGGFVLFGSPDQGVSWYEAGGQAVPDCDDVLAGDIHYEFMNKCLRGNSDGSQDLIENPLGYLGSKADYDQYVKETEANQH